MKYYENTLVWCKVFLLGTSFTPYKGKNIAFALLFDMNKLFESYVGHYLKKKYSNCNVKLQDKTHYLFEKPNVFALKPDIVINSGKIILDTKWKILTSEKTNNIYQSDMYQMFVYGVKYTECKKVYLVYPFVKNIDISNKVYKTTLCNNKTIIIEPIFFDLKNDRMECKGNKFF